MSFANHLVSSALLVGALFSLTTFPLAAFSSKPVTVELEQDTVFAGSLKDIAVPYLLTAAAISIGAGAANLAVMGWQQSSRKLVVMEGQMSKLTHQLSEKESQLESLRFSPLKLEAFGLAGFLAGDDQPMAQISAADDSTQLLPSNSTIRAIQIPAIAQAVTVNPSIYPPVSDQVLPNGVASMQTVASFPAAQSFMGFARPKPLEPKVAVPIQTLPVEQALSLDDRPLAGDLNLDNPAQVNELLSNLKQVMAQLEKLHTVQTQKTQNIVSYPHFAS